MVYKKAVLRNITIFTVIAIFNLTGAVVNYYNKVMLISIFVLKATEST